MAEVLFRAKLTRDGAQSPWGFRLQGGVEYNTPLTLLKVSDKSIAAKCGLKPGDIVVKIAGKSADGMSHKEAQQAIVSAGNNLEVIVERAEATVPSPISPISPTYDASFDSDCFLTAAQTASSQPPEVIAPTQKTPNGPGKPQSITQEIPSLQSQPANTNNHDHTIADLHSSRTTDEKLTISAEVLSSSPETEKSPVIYQTKPPLDKVIKTPERQRKIILQQMGKNQENKSVELDQADGVPDVSKNSPSSTKYPHSLLYSRVSSNSSDSDDSIQEKRVSQIVHSSSGSSSGSLESIPSLAENCQTVLKDSKYPWRRARGKQEELHVRSVSEPARSLLEKNNNSKVVVMQKSISVSSLSNNDNRFKPIKATFKQGQLAAVKEENQPRDVGDRMKDGSFIKSPSEMSAVKKAQEFFAQQVNAQNSTPVITQKPVSDVPSMNTLKPEENDFNKAANATLFINHSSDLVHPVVGASIAKFDQPVPSNSVEIRCGVTVPDPDLIGVNLPAVKDIVSSIEESLKTAVITKPEIGLTFIDKVTKTSSTGSSGNWLPQPIDVTKVMVRTSVGEDLLISSPSALSPSQRRVRFAEPPEASVIEIEANNRRLLSRERRREDKYPEFYKSKENFAPSSTTSLPEFTDASRQPEDLMYKSVQELTERLDKIERENEISNMTFRNTLLKSRNEAVGQKSVSLPVAFQHAHAGLERTIPVITHQSMPTFVSDQDRPKQYNYSEQVITNYGSRDTQNPYPKPEVIGQFLPVNAVSSSKQPSPIQFRYTYTTTPTVAGFRPTQSAYDMYKTSRRNSTGGIMLTTARRPPSHGFTVSIGGGNNQKTPGHINVSFRQQVGSDSPTEYSFQIPRGQAVSPGAAQQIVYSVSPDVHRMQRRDGRGMSISFGTPPRELPLQTGPVFQQHPQDPRVVPISYQPRTASPLISSPQSPVPTRLANRVSPSPLPNTDHAGGYNAAQRFPYQFPPPYYPSSSPPPWSSTPPGHMELSQSKFFKQLESHLSHGVPQPPTSARPYIPASSPPTVPPQTTRQMRAHIKSPTAEVDLYTSPSAVKAFEQTPGLLAFFDKSFSAKFLQSQVNPEREPGYQQSATYRLVQEMDKEQHSEDPTDLPYVDL